MDKTKEYERICKKLGFEPSRYVAPKIKTEDDSWKNPFLKLSSEEIDFLYVNGYMSNN